jgi:hypothetical protein
MCIFSKPVIDVSKTKIFARKSSRYQYLAYQMDFQLHDQTAIILPIPSVKNTPEDGVEFINFKQHADFFQQLNELFQEHIEGKGSLGINLTYSMPLKVHNVGDFEASFIPTLNDFDRVDERFKLKPEIWQQLPQYKDYGFVVFKLSPHATTVHPMVFKFPTDMADLYFPTLHIHDGEIHKLEHFDHTLYCQKDENVLVPASWQGRKLNNHFYFRHGQTCEGVLNLDNTVYMRKVTGTQRNEDIILKRRDSI